MCVYLPEVYFLAVFNLIKVQKLIFNIFNDEYSFCHTSDLKSESNRQHCQVLNMATLTDLPRDDLQVPDFVGQNPKDVVTDDSEPEFEPETESESDTEMTDLEFAKQAALRQAPKTGKQKQKKYVPTKEELAANQAKIAEIQAAAARQSDLNVLKTGGVLHDPGLKNGVIFAELFFCLFYINVSVKTWNKQRQVHVSIHCANRHLSDMIQKVCFSKEEINGKGDKVSKLDPFKSTLSDPATSKTIKARDGVTYFFNQANGSVSIIFNLSYKSRRGTAPPPFIDNLETRLKLVVELAQFVDSFMPYRLIIKTTDANFMKDLLDKFPSETGTNGYRFDDKKQRHLVDVESELGFVKTMQLSYDIAAYCAEHKVDTLSPFQSIAEYNVDMITFWEQMTPFTDKEYPDFSQPFSITDDRTLTLLGFRREVVDVRLFKHPTVPNFISMTVQFSRQHQDLDIAVNEKQGKHGITSHHLRTTDTDNKPIVVPPANHSIRLLINDLHDDACVVFSFSAKCNMQETFSAVADTVKRGISF